LQSEAGPKQKGQDPTWKITKAKRAGGMAQVVECLPSKALSSTQKLLNKKTQKTNKQKPIKDPKES
jgi:hypothetical protein